MAVWILLSLLVLVPLLTGCSAFRAIGGYGQARGDAAALSMRGGEGVDINCTETNPHPVGQSIAAEFDVPYEQVMTWFCGGRAFEDILLALQTRALTDRSIEELFDMAEEMGWQEVWEHLGLFTE